MLLYLAFSVVLLGLTFLSIGISVVKAAKTKEWVMDLGLFLVFVKIHFNCLFLMIYINNCTHDTIKF